MDTSKRRILAVISALTLVAAAGCAGGGQQGGSADQAEFVKDGTFTTVINQDAGTLHPLITNFVAAQVVGSYLYDSLLFFDPKTGKPLPYLAEKWTEESAKVTFTLKRGITCDDGSPFTATTAAANINWIVDKKNSSPLRDSIIPSDAKATADEDTNTLTVSVSKPKAFLLFNVGAQQMACQPALDDPDGYKAKSAGTGLFELTKVVPNDHYELTRRDGYDWGPEGKTTSNTLGVPKKVTVRVIKNPGTVANLLLSGEVNMSTVTGPDVARVEQLPSKSSPRMSGEMSFNQMPGKPTAEFAVRKALVQAVDLDAWTKVHTSELGERAKSMSVLAPAPCRYDSISDNVPEYDTAAAAKTLDEAGWVKGSDGVRVKNGKRLELVMFFLNTTDSASAAAELMQKQWRQLGVDVSLKGGDSNFLLNSVFAPKDPSSWDVTPTLTLQSNLPTIFPPYFTGASQPKGTNYSSVDNPEYTAAARKANETAGDESCAAWAKADAALIKQLNVLPISVTRDKTYFNGATAVYDPVTSIVPGVTVRVVGK